MTLTLSDLVPEQMPEVVAEGFQFTEGPVMAPGGLPAVQRHSGGYHFPIHPRRRHRPLSLTQP